MTLKEFVNDDIILQAIEHSIWFLRGDDELEEVDTKSIHEIMWLPRAYVAEDSYLIGWQDLSTLIYYAGAEHCTKLVFLCDGIYIYECEEIERFPVKF